MKELTYKNQHEIGFDIDCLPAWAKYIAVDECGEWYHYMETPELLRTANMWVLDKRWGVSGVMPIKYTPKKFSGNWEESLFKINRENLVNYNGAVI